MSPSVSAQRESVASRHLLLVGGGHAHLEVLRQIAERPIANVRVTLVSPHAHHAYSSVVPAYLQGDSDVDDFTFDLRAICQAANAEFVQGYARSIDSAARTVRTDTDVITYDVLSLDVGSEPLGLETPGVREHAVTLRPMTRAIDLRARLEGTLAGGEPVCVVGAGAAGIEMALAIVGRGSAVTLVDRIPHLDERIRRVLIERGVQLRLGNGVRSVRAAHVQLENGVRVDAALTIWLTGAAAVPLLGDFLVVDDTLRAEHDHRIFGAGDCVTLANYPDVAKAGVYAVREAPILAHNLRVAIEGGAAESFRRYVPQKQFLTILNTGDGRGLLRWHGLTVHAHWAMWLKRWIDRRFVRKYQRIGSPLSS